MELASNEDTIGAELPDGNAVRREARVRALRALRDGFANGEDRRDWVMVIRDERGASVIRLTLGEAAGAALATVLN